MSSNIRTEEVEEFLRGYVPKKDLVVGIESFFEALIVEEKRWPLESFLFILDSGELKTHYDRGSFKRLGLSYDFMVAIIKYFEKNSA